MGNLFSTQEDLNEDFVKDLMKETGFSQKQIHRLYIRFRHLDKDKKGYLIKSSSDNKHFFSINRKKQVLTKIIASCCCTLKNA